MKKFAFSALTALAFATHAMAKDTAAETQTTLFTGARISENLGFADDDAFGTNELTYGAEAGFDFDAGGAVVGVSAEYQYTVDTGRHLSATARLGGKLTPNLLVYGLAGYTNLKVAGLKFDGLRVGAGIETAIGRNAFAKFEHRYSNYEGGGNDDFHQNLIGVGLRF